MLCTYDTSLRSIVGHVEGRCDCQPVTLTLAMPRVKAVLRLESEPGKLDLYRRLGIMLTRSDPDVASALTPSGRETQSVVAGCQRQTRSVNRKAISRDDYFIFIFLSPARQSRLASRTFPFP